MGSDVWEKFPNNVVFFFEGVPNRNPRENEIEDIRNLKEKDDVVWDL